MKLVHWSLMGGLLHLVQRGGDWAGYRAQSAHPSTTSVPITAKDWYKDIVPMGRHDKLPPQSVGHGTRIAVARCHPI